MPAPEITSESIDLQGLDQGFYFVRVAGIEGMTNYTLNLTGTPGLGLSLCVNKPKKAT
jgi:hypothetical protein